VIAPLFANFDGEKIMERGGTEFKKGNYLAKRESKNQTGKQLKLYVVNLRNPYKFVLAEISLPVMAINAILPHSHLLYQHIFMALPSPGPLGDPRHLFVVPNRSPIFDLRILELRFLM
jgi:hypothetical protein